MLQKLFLLFIFILPFSFALSPSAQIDLQLVRVLVPFLFLFWLLESLRTKKLLIDSRLQSWILLVFLFWSTLSYFWAIDQERALRKILFFGSLAPIYWVAFKMNSQKIFKMLFWSNLILAVLALVIFSLQFAIGLDPALVLIRKFIAPIFLGEAFSVMVLAFPSWLVNISGATILRTFGTFPDPHLFALYLNMSLPVIAWFFYRNRASARLAPTISLLIILLASLLSFSRAAYLSLFAGVVFWLITSNFVSLAKKHVLALLMLAFLFLVVLTVPNPLTNRLFSSFDLGEGSNSGRIQMWAEGAEATWGNPLLGLGLGGFSKHVDPASGLRSPIYAHNLFLDFSSELGLFGGLLTLTLVVMPIFAYFKKPTLLNRVLATCFVIFFVHSLFETPFYSVRVFPLFLVLLSISSFSDSSASDSPVLSNNYHQK